MQTVPRDCIDTEHNSGPMHWWFVICDGLLHLCQNELTWEDSDGLRGETKGPASAHPALGLTLVATGANCPFAALTDPAEAVATVYKDVSCNMWWLCNKDALIALSSRLHCTPL